MPKGDYHPSITTHRQKLIRQRDYEKLNQKSPKPKLETIDLSKSDWSNKRKKK